MILIYPIAFLLYYILLCRNKHNALFSIVFIYYLFSMIAAVFLSRSNLGVGIELDFFAVLFHIVLLIILIHPLRRIRLGYGKEMFKSPYVIVKTISLIVIALSLVSIYSSLSDISVDKILVDVNDSRRALTEKNNNSTILGYIIYISRLYWGLAIALMFYFMIFYPHKRLYIVLLAVSSLSMIVNGLEFAAREYLLKYIFIYVCVFLLLGNQLHPIWKKFTIRYLLYTGLLFVAIFVLISFARFSDNLVFNNGVTESLLSYYGQSYLNFSERFVNFKSGLAGGSLGFPFFVNSSLSKFNLNDTFYTDVSLNSFSTVIGSWIVDVGVLFTVIITVIYNFIFRLVIRQRPSIFMVLYLVWILEFIFSSIFFFNDILNGTRIFSILLIVVFDYTSTKLYRSGC